MSNLLALAMTIMQARLMNTNTLKRCLSIEKKGIAVYHDDCAQSTKLFEPVSNLKSQVSCGIWLRYSVQALGVAGKDTSFQARRALLFSSGFSSIQGA